MSTWRKVVVCLFAAVAAFVAQAGGEVVTGEMVVTAGDFDAGTFTLAFPAQSKAANLYLTMTDDYNAQPDTWQNPVFLQQVAAGATSAEVTVPNWSPESVLKYRFLLADPALAKVRRYDCVEGQGGAFMTDLYPDASTACELTFAMTSLTPDQSWLFCARKDQDNTASDYLLAVRGGTNSNADKSRFGYDVTGNLTGGNKLSVGTKYTFVATIASDGSKKYFKLTPADDETTIVHDEVFDYVEKFALTYRMSFGGSSTAGTFDGITAQTASAKYYSFKMWESVDGALQADYRPCTWKDPQQRVHVGFYDVVRGAFYEAGTHIESSQGNVGSFIVPAGVEELPVDTLVDHLGTPLAATAIIYTSLKSEVVSEEGFTQYEFNGLPEYGSFSSDVGETKTFTAPAGEFDFVREDGRLEQVKCCGVRIDVYDQDLGRFVNGPVQKTTSCTWTKQLYDEIVRIVWLWDVRRKTTSFSGLRADSLRLKTGTGDTNNGWVEQNCGFFDTGIHPNPQTTRVSFKVRIAPFNIDLSNFFGVRQGSDAAVKRNSSFFLCRTDIGVRLDLCGTSYVGANELYTPGGFLGKDERSWLEFDILNGDVKYRNASTNKKEYQGRVSERDNIELTPTLPIFGQARYNNGVNDVDKLEQALDAPETEYSAFMVWTNGTVLARDYVPCLDDANVPCFYDLVYDEYCYPNDGSTDKYEAVMGEGNNLVITAEPAEYFDCGKPMYGREKLANGQSKTYTMTERQSFRLSVSGYRIDTWDKDNGGWVNGAPQSGRTVTLTGDETKIRRLVWLWGKPKGLCIIIK